MTVDHTGVPNTILLKEDPTKSQYYKGRSVAEQNSVDLAWEMLMQDDFRDFREALYTTQEELLRFRQLVVNSVMVRVAWTESVAVAVVDAQSGSHALTPC